MVATRRERNSSRSSIGRANAAVFPDPACRNALDTASQQLLFQHEIGARATEWRTPTCHCAAGDVTAHQSKGNACSLHNSVQEL